ncbi:MAG TPA: DUF1980 domain-containing protein, partial [Acidimicrobiales bacterium]|nr:DUF1980 domain-containing protein [Acidimicrobiales bacterium]
MRRTDAAGLLAALGVLVLWLGLSDRILRYLRPTMRTWLVVTGVLLVVLAVAVGVSAWRDHRAGRRQPHRSGLVGWLIVMPLLVALCVDARALGAYTIRLGSTYTKVSDGDFDLESHLRSHSFTGQAAELQLNQFLSAASGSPDERRLLADTPVRLTGFVVNDDDTGSDNTGAGSGP